MDQQVARARLEQLFDAYGDRVMSYAVHRVGQDHASDVVAETFLAAWRRLEDVPEDALPWLLGTARRVIANQLRGHRRQEQLMISLVSSPAETASAGPDVEQRLDLLEALRQMSESDREVLLLSAWYDLTNAQAATVLGCSTTAYAVRLHRARQRLRRHLVRTQSAEADDFSLRLLEEQA